MQLAWGIIKSDDFKNLQQKVYRRPVFQKRVPFKCRLGSPQSAHWAFQALRRLRFSHQAEPLDSQLTASKRCLLSAGSSVKLPHTPVRMSAHQDARMYESKYPEVDDVVMVQVKSIAEMGAYVGLLEYNGIEGMILLSELSRRRIRSITKLIKVITTLAGSKL